MEAVRNLSPSLLAPSEVTQNGGGDPPPHPPTQRFFLHNAVFSNLNTPKFLFCQPRTDTDEQNSLVCFSTNVTAGLQQQSVTKKEQPIQCMHFATPPPNYPQSLAAPSGLRSVPGVTFGAYSVCCLSAQRSGSGPVFLFIRDQLIENTSVNIIPLVNGICRAN